MQKINNVIRRLDIYTIDFQRGKQIDIFQNKNEMVRHEKDRMLHLVFSDVKKL